MKTAKILKDNTIMVFTPIPYTVTACKDKSIEEIREVCDELSQSVMFLRNCFKLLGITKKEAREKNFALNISTGRELNNRAWLNRNISYEFVKLIKEHSW